jgi:hypothetical protein
MSEQAPEAPAGGGGGGGGSVFKRKLGPFPMWGWLAIGAVVILAYVIIKRQSASSAATTASTSTPASDIPQFVNQTYTTVTPPAAPPPATGLPSPPPVVANPGGPNVPAGGSTPRPTQITSTGTDTGDINQIAKKYGLTEQQLIAANPGLRKLRVKSPNGKSIPLIGSGAPIPRGTVIKIPAG